MVPAVSTVTAMSAARSVSRNLGSAHGRVARDPRGRARRVLMPTAHAGGVGGHRTICGLTPAAAWRASARGSRDRGRTGGRRTLMRGMIAGATGDGSTRGERRVTTHARWRARGDAAWDGGDRGAIGGA